MSNGIGMQNFSASNLQAGGRVERHTEYLRYTVQKGDTIDGDIATIIENYGTDNMKTAINNKYAENQGIKGNLNTGQKEEALLWYAHLKSDDVAKDSEIANRNEINPKDVLNLKSILHPDGEGGLDFSKGGLDFEKLGIDMMT